MSPVPTGALFRISPLLLAALAGMATVLGFAPFNLFLLPVATVALLIVLWQRAGSVRKAALIGFVFGLGCFLTGVSWVYVSLHDFGAMPAVLAAGLTLLFCCILAAYPAAIGGAYFALGTRSVWTTVAVVPALWMLADWTRGWLFTGFPWIALGYAQVPVSPLAGYVPVVGVYGVTWATVLSAALIVTLWQARKRRAWLWSALLVALWAGGYGLQQIAWTTP
ncbi:MAG: apolipoprotein N-acyltransferase, partial [Burkholderiales bacterium]